MSRPSRVVETKSGPVRGKTFEFEDKPAASAFLGIPYAQPPVGDLRFKKPLPAKPWTKVKECQKFTPACPHVPVNPMRMLEYAEDCLYLNVFTPENAKPESKLPVLFYIHGGGFIIDSAELIGDEGICRYLCSKDIVVVSINYRLGIFGFLTLNNEKCPGNFGFWDMALALQWVHENIEAFGGAPNQITVAGQSAGGVAVDVLTLSPHTRDLFAQGLIFAGTTYGVWLNMNAEHSRNTLIEWAKYKGCKVEGRTEEEVNKEVLEFLRNQPADRLAAGMFPDPKFEFLPASTLPLGPQLDGDFLPKSLKELRKEAPRKPIVNGVTECEGLLMSMGKMQFPERSFKDHAAQMLQNLRPDFSSEFSSKCVNECLNKCEHEDGSLEHTAKCIEVVSDFMFNDGAYRFGIERTKLGDRVYNFVFKHYKKGLLGPFGAQMPFEAATHCTELPFFFGKSILGDFTVEAEDEPVIDRFTTYLVSFIKNGDPNNEKFEKKWLPVDETHPGRHFVFTTDDAQLEEDFGGGRMEHWTRAFESKRS